MLMKRFKIFHLVILLLALSGCDQNFLDRTPLDAVTSPDYFKTPNDLRAYVNQYYSSTFFPKYANHGSDRGSDNQIAQAPDQRLEGTRTIATSGSIGFGNVRSINYFFENYKKVEQSYSLKDYQQYLGEAYFFRALIYYSLLQTYGDIQVITKVLGTSSPELYNPRDARNVVADHIISSLDSAAIYLTTDKTKGAGRVNKWMALLIQSRVALFEGSWEKYHANTPFGAAGGNPQKYFAKAAEAALKVMESGVYNIYSTGKPSSDYKDLFALQDYSSNPEVMFWREYNNDLTRGDVDFVNDRNIRMETPSGNTLTKELADAYLCTDGKAISQSPLFMGYSDLTKEIQNRDPRFAQTIAPPAETWKIFANGTSQTWKDAYDRLNSTADFNAPTGYIIQKGYNPNMVYHVQQYEQSPAIIYRYAEVLLNYAEAKAELGTITQQDIDISVKKLRDRAGMPNLVINGIETDPKWDFPGLSPLINEIRRERRVELALEGFRWNDIARWAAANQLIIGKRPKGFKASQIKVNPFSVDEDGFLDPFKNALPNGYRFKPDRDYLNSIPMSEIVLNPALTQNPGWF